jgi:hypothetical protein
VAPPTGLVLAASGEPIVAMLALLRAAVISARQRRAPSASALS